MGNTVAPVLRYLVFFKKNLFRKLILVGYCSFVLASKRRVCGVLVASAFQEHPF